MNDMPVSGEMGAEPNGRSIRYVIIGLCLLTLLILGIRFGVRYFQGMPVSYDSAWQMRWQIDFQADEPNQSFTLYLPGETAFISIYSQYLDHPGLRIIRPSKRSTSRVISVIARRPGRYRFKADFDLYLHAQAVNSISLPDDLNARERKQYLAIDIDDPLLEPFNELPGKIGADVEDETALTDQIFNTVRETLVDTDKDQTDAERDLLLSRSMVVLSRTNFVPARLVTGFALYDSGGVTPQHWVEIWINNRWESFDPADGYRRQLPPHYLPVRSSEPRILDFPEEMMIKPHFSINRQSIPAGLFGHKSSIYDILDFSRLSYEDRNTIALLLVLPLGGLITVLLRRVIGMHPYGTFAPTLLALSASFTDWLALAIVFIIIVAFGLMGRAMLPGMNLARLPRLGIVFTLVSITMVFSISVMRYAGYHPGNTGMLLPMVVMTILVDSFYRTADTEGRRAALMRLVWTIVVAAIVLIAFLFEPLGKILLSYPELHLLTIALIILISRYNGPKLIR